MILEIIKIPPENIIPSATDILKIQGISKNEIPNGKTLILVEEAIQSLIIKACPAGILMEISKDDFEIIFNGEGMNETRAPLDLIYLDDDGRVVDTVESFPTFRANPSKTRPTSLLAVPAVISKGLLVSEVYDGLLLAVSV